MDCIPWTYLRGQRSVLSHGRLSAKVGMSLLLTAVSLLLSAVPSKAACDPEVCPRTRSRARMRAIDVPSKVACDPEENQCTPSHAPKHPCIHAHDVLSKVVCNTVVQSHKQSKILTYPNARCSSQATDQITYTVTRARSYPITRCTEPGRV